jgi:hypothetical protein
VESDFQVVKWKINYCHQEDCTKSERKVEMKVETLRKQTFKGEKETKNGEGKWYKNSILLESYRNEENKRMNSNKLFGP